MASWKGLYRNVDLGLEDPKAHEQRSQPGPNEYSEEESVYEPFDAVATLESKPAAQATDKWNPAEKPSWTRRVALVAVVALLATSVFLNVLLLAVGIVRYSKMASTLEQVRAENRKLQEAVPASFLLYNEDRKHCVTEKQSRSLTKAACDPGDRGQHFLWLYRSHLLHVDSLLCVAAPKAENKKILLLEPCDVWSPLQRWECRDHDLLALKDKDLYFNYGNSPDHVVWLYNGNGPWSRWLVYGTHQNICSTLGNRTSPIMKM